MPDGVLIPAPVRAATWRASRQRDAAVAIKESMLVTMFSARETRVYQ
jgi:hypothetical protein